MAIENVPGQPGEPNGQGGAGGDYIIDPQLDSATADRLKKVGVAQAHFCGDKVLARWVADGLEKVPKGQAVPLVIEANSGPFIARPQAVSYYDIGSDAIMLNPAYNWASVAAHAKILGFRRFWSSGDPHHALLHEVGHLNHRRALGDDKVFSAGGRRGTITSASDVAIIEQEVSLYAATSKNNFVAEAFAGRAVGKRYDSAVMRLYHATGGP